jgi:hypothetical protein
MNSLPFISHHLFVAAIGNEGHVHEKPGRQKSLSAEVADDAAASVLAGVDERTPFFRRGFHPLRTPAPQARA